MPPRDGPLLPAEVAAYGRDGYVVPRLRLAQAEVARLRGALDRLVTANPGVRPERLVSAHLPDAGKEGVRGVEEFFALAVHPLILDAVAQVFGHDNICLWGVQVFCKPGGDGMEVPLHQDGNYWPIRPLATVTAWVAIDRSDRSNGCLRVVPTSHTARRHFSHEKSDAPRLVLNQAVTQEELAGLPAPADIELDPGQFSLHDVYAVHGSNPNTSPARRAGVALRYMPTSSVFERGLFKVDADAGYLVDWANRPIFLVRGTDLSGRNRITSAPSPLPRL